MRQIEFVSLVPGERRELFALFEECFGHPADDAWWKWKYESTPYGRGLNLLALVDGDLAGHYGAYGVKCQRANGEVFWVNQIGDVMISPRYRGVGVGKKALITRLTHAFYDTFCKGVAFNYGCPSERHARLGRALLKYEVLDPITVWELDLGKWEPKRPSRSGWRAFRRALTRSNIVKRPGFNECSRLYETLSHQYGLSIVRDSAYLSWRYEKRPGAAYEPLGVSRMGGLRLWTVLKVVDEVVELGDLLFHFGDQDAMLHLIEYLKQLFPEKRLRVWGNPHILPMVEMFRALGFEARLHPERIYLTATIFDPVGFPSRLIRSGFYYQAGDFDLF